MGRTAPRDIAVADGPVLVMLTTGTIFRRIC
jgi:hypothetical protein